MTSLARYTLFLCLVWQASSDVSRAENWPRFRGPNGEGQSNTTGIPTRWDRSDYNWRVKLPSVGHSSPVVWDELVYVTSANLDDATLHVEARGTEDGQVVWSKHFRPDVAVKPEDARQGYASSTPALDADKIYFVQVQPKTILLIALNRTNGDEVWRFDVGRFDCKYSYGTSPIVYGGLVILAHEHMGESFLVAVDADTGQQRWKIPREALLTCYSVPCVLESAGNQPQVLFQSTAHGITSVDPSSGTINWQIDVGEERTVASPALAAGLVVATSGIGPGGVDLAVVQPGNDNVKPKVLYNVARSLPYVPTPVAHGDLLFLWSDGGVATCLDAKSGDVHWRKRVGGNYRCSPVRVGDYLYSISRGGEAVVIAASTKYKMVHRISLQETSWSTPAVADGCMYLRTESHLMSLGEKPQMTNDK